MVPELSQPRFYMDYLHYSEDLIPRASRRDERGSYQARKALLRVAILNIQNLVSSDTECFRDIENPLVEKPALTAFDIDQHIARHTRAKSQGLLGEPALNSQCPDLRADRDTVALPLLGAVWISLVWSGRHGIKYCRRQQNSLPH